MNADRIDSDSGSSHVNMRAVPCKCMSLGRRTSERPTLQGRSDALLQELVHYFHKEQPKGDGAILIFLPGCLWVDSFSLQGMVCVALF